MTDNINQKIKCGIIMPISTIDGCSSDHWIEVKEIIIEACKSITAYNVETKIVSEANSVGVIQKTIIQNLYESDIIVCDVSAKNPNVMFELGMRLAFDKPTIIIKDDKTDYSFDTGVIEHLEYPRDLRFRQIIDFKENLAYKLKSTLEESNENNHATFLKSFGTFKVATIEKEPTSIENMMYDMLKTMQVDIANLKHAKSGKISSQLQFQLKLNETRVITLIKEYMLRHNIKDPEMLIGDEDFYKYLYKKLNTNYNILFDKSYLAFVDFIDTLLTSEITKEIVNNW